MFAIEMLPAYQGDCLWIEYGEPANPSRILIDGGMVGTTEHILERIRRVATDGDGTCHLELMVLSHVDADHVEGLVKLLGTRDVPLSIGDIWFNGYHHMPDPSASRDDEFLSATQGEFLAALIRERGLPWNAAFGGDTVYAPRPEKGALPRATLPGGMELIVVSPGFEELLKMSRRWDDELEDQGLLHATHEEMMEALGRDRRLAPDDDFLSDEELDVEALLSDRKRRDSSAANGSSIGLLGRFDGKSCLFSGDAYWQVLRDSARRLAQEEGVERVPLDAFKLPHHGSRNNLNDELLALLDCRSFLVSTNGDRFKHPDSEALAHLLAGSWRPTPADDRPVQLVFNYRTEFNEGWDDDALRARWNYRTVYPDAGVEGLRVEL
ncbi:MAG: hypothetical protein AAF682_29895 [Planctomycetota bacterium]